MDDANLRALRSQLERIPPQLAAEALEEAASRARVILVERLTQILVAEAESCLTAHVAPPPPVAHPQEAAAPEQAAAPEPEASAEPAAGAGPDATPERAAPPDQETVEPAAAPEPEAGCYLFAIARAGGPPLPSIQGMGGSGTVREVVSGRLAGVVCDIPLSLFDGLEQEAIGPESRLAGLARRHDEVVRAAFERRAVLPLRFGTVLTSEDQLVGVLEEQQEQLLPELQRLEGKAEWTCRVQADPAATTTSRPGRPQVGGAAYLAERERELAATAEKDPFGVDEAAGRVAQAVEAHVEAALPPDPAGEEARVSFLVADEAQERFAGAVAGVAEASPALRIELLGPHPPYHFASVQLGDGR